MNEGRRDRRGLSFSAHRWRVVSQFRILIRTAPASGATRADASPGGSQCNEGVATTPVDDKPEGCQNRIVPRLRTVARPGGCPREKAPVDQLRRGLSMRVSTMLPRVSAQQSLDWLKSKNPAAPAVTREAEEDWSKERWR
jgi:hypothetical protein